MLIAVDAINPASPFAWRRLFVIYLVGAATVVVWWIGYRLVWVNVLNLPYLGRGTVGSPASSLPRR